MKSKTLNMTEGNPVQLILIFAVPMLIGNVFQQLYNLVDSVIVGKFVGAEALASIGATNAVTFMFFATHSIHHVSVSLHSRWNAEQLLFFYFTTRILY